jgi:hypothetical protein
MITQVNINRKHPTFATIDILVNADKLVIDSETKCVALSCTAQYMDGTNNVTATLAPKQVLLIATNAETQTTPGGEVGMYDFLNSYLSKPVPVNTLIAQYITKNADKFV